MISKHTALTGRPRLHSLVVSAFALTLGLYACAPATPLANPQANPQANQSASPAETTDTASSANAEPAVYAKEGIAISGADPVAYFNESAFVEGSADYTYDWDGVTWQFANAENRDLFASSPETYAPQYGGYCAWAVGAKKALVPTDPNAWKVVDGKLYLNANEKVQKTWIKDIPGNIALADTNWPEVAAQ